VADRLATWNARFIIAPDKLPAAVDWIVGRVREKADRLVGLPPGESIDFEYVSGGPWGAFSKYEGRLHTLVEINTEQICRPADLVHMAALDCYPGRHTEHAWKERRLVGDLGRFEASVSLLNTPADWRLPRTPPRPAKRPTSRSGSSGRWGAFEPSSPTPPSCSTATARLEMTCWHICAAIWSPDPTGPRSNWH
jgi:hypothetical protein